MFEINLNKLEWEIIHVNFWEYFPKIPASLQNAKQSAIDWRSNPVSR